MGNGEFGPLQNPNPLTDCQKIVTVDYVRETTRYTNFGANPSAGGFWADGWNITLNYFYIHTYVHTYVHIPFFRGTTHRSDPSTDFDAWWLNRREITQGCGFWGLQKLLVTFNPFLAPQTSIFGEKTDLDGDFKYVVVFDPLLSDHVIRRMRSEPGSQLKSMKSVFCVFLNNR